MEKLLTSEYRIEKPTSIVQMLEDATFAELRRDSEALEVILSPFWTDFEKDPDFFTDDPILQGDFLRICGLFLSAVGHSQGIGDYQERGKNLISKAIRCFEEENCLHKVNDAKVSLAAMYYYEGRVDECDTILNEAGSYYERNQLHPVYLSVCLNKIGVLHWKREYSEAFEIVKEIEIPMSVCEDLLLIGRYHNQAGIIYNRIGKDKIAQEHYKEAIRYASEVDSPRHEGLFLNNLAFSCNSAGKYDEAQEHAEHAYSIFNELKEMNWLAMTLDTLAQIYLRQNKFDLAMDRIDESAKIFRKSDSFGELTDALWVKVLILLRSENKEEAFVQFSDLAEIAKREIGEFAVRKYAKEFSKLVYILSGSDYHQEVETFKRKILVGSIVESNADLDAAAGKLHTTRRDLVNILNREFPEIYLDLGISTQVMTTANH